MTPTVFLLPVVLLLQGAYGVFPGEENTHHMLALADSPYVTSWSSRSCEDQSINLWCEPGRQIHLTGAMFWGRRDQDSCTGTELNTDSTVCTAENSVGWKTLIANACEGENECEVAATAANLGTDPCPGIHKVLEIGYKCKLPTSAELICEDEVLQLSCPDNMVLKVYAAFYGREFSPYCNADGATLATNCASADDIAAKVGAICDGRSECTVEVNNAYLNDPCTGTSKYLSVNYVCDVCDNGHSDDAKCEEWAEQGECAANVPWMNSQCTKSCWSCGLDNERCDDLYDDCSWWASRGECELNNWMINNCARSCRTCPPSPDFSAEEGVEYVAEVCEGRWVYTNCGQDSDLVLAITDVFYGRTENTTCPHESITTLDCQPPAGMLRKAQELCDGRDSCYLGADSWQWGSDPCPGTYKYLKIEHQCRACSDWLTTASCKGLKTAGECVSNRAYMMDNCFATCTGCQYSDCPNMLGVDKDCDRWAPDGECDTNPDMMREQCKQSCGLCTEDEDDTCINWWGTSTCEYWKSIGECEKNPFWMRNNCQDVCDMCDEDGCTNKDVHCAYWANLGECQLNPNFMLNNCKRSCSDCAGETGECVNGLGMDMLCGEWAAKGDCATDPDFMNPSCAKACSFC